MKQNKYDDHDFFNRYSEMPRSVGGLEAAGEWHLLKEMLPDLKGKSVLDLGCGYGWHCRYARERGASSVVGLDLSENMLQRAREMTDDPAITYRCQAIEDLHGEDGSFDVVLSSLALHYVEDMNLVAKHIYKLLSPGGHFVLSVEHPIFTSRGNQDWHYGADGSREHWPVDGYAMEGRRQTRFLDADVIKYHRTVSSYVNALIQAGFAIGELRESVPSQEALAQYPEMKDELRRPMFLLMAATKGAIPKG